MKKPRTRIESCLLGVFRALKTFSRAHFACFPVEDGGGEAVLVLHSNLTAESVYKVNHNFIWGEGGGKHVRRVAMFQVFTTEVPGGAMICQKEK